MLLEREFLIVEILKSEMELLKTCVPQGSILSPLLFVNGLNFYALSTNQSLNRYQR